MTFHRIIPNRILHSILLLSSAFSWPAIAAEQESANLFRDPSFEASDLNDADMYYGGSVALRKTQALNGQVSLSANYEKPESELAFEINPSSAMVKSRFIRVSAKVRNETTKTLTLDLCAGAFDAQWASLRSCVPVLLSKGETKEAKAELLFAEGTSLERAQLLINNRSATAIELSIDDISLVLAVNAGASVETSPVAETNPPVEGRPDPGTVPGVEVKPDPVIPGMFELEAIPDSSSHPRLMLTQADLPRLQSWATLVNPIYAALLDRANTAKAEMDAGKVPADDIGTSTWVDTPSEAYASLFAFMSLLSRDPTEAADWARRSRICLMHIIDRAKLGQADAPFRHEDFATNDRGRWNGEAFALTVDWIYPYLSTEDKASIRKVFLRWTQELLQDSYHHPEPLFVMNDPQLVAKKDQLRWANNNYFNAAMRNVGFMAMSLDAKDDPGAQLRPQLRRATGSWLYVVDKLLRSDAKGGFLAEGFEYSPQSMAYQTQFLWSLQTAGLDQPQLFGEQVRFNNPFWKEALPALLLSLTPRSTVLDWRGPVYQATWYGAGQNFLLPDLIATLTPIALQAMAQGDLDTVNAVRWMQINTAPGGKEALIERVREADSPLQSILYFMLFDPGAAAVKDPRPALNSSHFAPGIGRLLARSDWSEDASLFSFGLSWLGIDHQTGDGLSFDFYRKGEWLTKRRIGYSDEDYGMSDNHNTLTIENSKPDHDDVRRTEIWKRGSQNALAPDGDPKIIAQSQQTNFVYALGDATALYNSEHENTHDVSHVSRSIVYLKPDIVIAYDRTESSVENRFKRFHLQFPAAAALLGKVITMQTAGGQSLAITSLLPLNSSIKIEPLADEPSGTPANFDNTSHRLTVEGSKQSKTERFLHVLEGRDADRTASPTQLISSEEGLMQGAIIQKTVVLFPLSLVDLPKITYKVPSDTAHHLITGLVPNASYSLSKSITAQTLTVIVTKGGELRADKGGVLWSD